MRFPQVISDDALMVFATTVALVAATVAFVAYVGTWISARRHQRKAATGAQSPRAARPTAAPDRSDGARESAGTLRP